jgi:Domain of unknown function (DUF4276)
MKRVIIICEGETEREFCQKLLSSFFVLKDIHIQPPLIKKSMGGIVKWKHLRRQIHNHLKEDHEAIVTTFIDYYGLYAKYEFPQWDAAVKIHDKNQKMDFLENAMSEDIDEAFRHRYLPYLQLHEFEGLLFNDIQIFYEQIPPDDLIGENELKSVFINFDNPEMINDVRETSPSHRLTRIIKGYNKIVYGNIIADAIGLDAIRMKSPRFNNWLAKIEAM